MPSDNRPIIIDIDLDFFLNHEADILDQPSKDASKKPTIDEFFENFSGLTFTNLVSHDEAYAHWVENNCENTICYHFDYHHDLYIDPEELLSMSLACLDGQINIGNYAAIAAKSGMIKKYVWIYPDHCTNNTIDNVNRISSLLEIEIESISYSDFCRKYIDKIDVSNVVSASIAISPDFCSESVIRNYINTRNLDIEFRYEVYDYLYEILYSDRYDPHKKYIRLDYSNKSKIYFHGSPISNLKEIGFDGHKLHMSPSIDFALCYLLKPDTALGWIQGIDNISSKNERIYLIPPKYNLYSEYSKVSGSIYIVTEFSTPESNSSGCKDFDKIFSGVFPIYKEIYFNHDQIKEKISKTIINYNQAISLKLLGTESLQDGSFQNWMEMSTESLAILRSTPFNLMVHNCINNKYENTFFPLVYWERLAIRDLLNKIPHALCGSLDNGYHGLSHCIDVALFTVIYSYSEKLNPFPSFMSALAHDLHPTSKNENPNQIDSAQIIEYLLLKDWNIYSGEFDSLIIDAVRYHSNNQKAKNIYSGILRDADRARLAWERGYKAEYFHTNIGMEMASIPSLYLHGIKQLLMFSENVVIEISFIENNFVYTVWNLNLRFKLFSSLYFLSAEVNYFVSITNATRVVFINCIDKVESSAITDLTYDIDIYFTVEITKFHLFDYEGINNRLKLMLTGSINEYLDSKDLISDSISLNKTSIHLSFNDYCFDKIIKDIDHFSMDHIKLNYVSISEQNDFSALQKFTNNIIELKKINDNASSFRIIYFYSWCWLESPQSASSIFSKAKFSYSPLTYSIGEIYGKDIYGEVLSITRRRMKKCELCIFSINCPSYEFVHNDQIPIKSPKNKTIFIDWKPDSL
jgi:hypothetical protein